MMVFRLWWIVVQLRPQAAKANRGGRNYRGITVIDKKYIDIEDILNNLKSDQMKINNSTTDYLK